MVLLDFKEQLWESRLKFKQTACAHLVKAGSQNLLSNVDFKGHFVVEHWRNGKHFNEYHFSNAVTNQGKNKVLDVMFHAVTQITAWYLGLIDNTNYSALAATDTYDDINQTGNGWDEFTSYTDPGNGDSSTTRPAWDEGSASGQTITNSTVATFDITGSGTVKGLFLVGGGAACDTKEDHASDGTLWATALFSSGDVTVQNGDQLKVTYTVSA